MRERGWGARERVGWVREGGVGCEREGGMGCEREGGMGCEREGGVGCEREGGMGCEREDEVRERGWGARERLGYEKECRVRERGWGARKSVGCEGEGGVRERGWGARKSVGCEGEGGWGESERVGCGWVGVRGVGFSLQKQLYWEMGVAEVFVLQKRHIYSLRSHLQRSHETKGWARSWGMGCDGGGEIGGGGRGRGWKATGWWGCIARYPRKIQLTEIVGFSRPVSNLVLSRSLNRQDDMRVRHHSSKSKRRSHSLFTTTVAQTDTGKNSKPSKRRERQMGF